jgi:5'-3' exonuclease
MGIPSYFRHLILNHRNIISVLNSSIKIHNFYIDANSIIYDNIKRTTYNNINNNNNNEYDHIIYFTHLLEKKNIIKIV